MVDCEICMEIIPLDCFEFFPCSHKICKFCYSNIKKLECPFCRLSIEPESDIEADIESDLNDVPPLVLKKMRNKKRRNRTTTERFSIY